MEVGRKERLAATEAAEAALESLVILLCVSKLKARLKGVGAMHLFEASRSNGRGPEGGLCSRKVDRLRAAAAVVLLSIDPRAGGSMEGRVAGFSFSSAVRKNRFRARLSASDHVSLHPNLLLSIAPTEPKRTSRACRVVCVIVSRHRQCSIHASLLRRARKVWDHYANYEVVSSGTAVDD